MKVITTAARELWGLFVDDGALALGLIAWCGMAAFGLPLLPAPDWVRGPILFLGFLLVLLANIAATVRKRSRG